MGREPIQRRPNVTLPAGWHARNNYGIPYRPKDKPEQEDWHTVARKFGVGVNQLIYFNFLTTNPDEVNWYLKHHVHCTKVSPSGNNFMFSNTGYIYIPPADDRQFTYEDEQHLCSWWWPDTENFIKQLGIVANALAKNPGTRNRGGRIKKLVDVIVRVEYPYCLKLWYYNDMNISTFADIKTTGAKLREMTKATQGAYPFAGQSGLYSQSGPEERHRGFWQIHPVQELFDSFCGKPWAADKLAEALGQIDDYMWKGWHTLADVSDRLEAFGGGNAVHDMVWNFINHVRLLAKDKDHLYSAFDS